MYLLLISIIYGNPELLFPLWLNEFPSLSYKKGAVNKQ